VVVLNVENRGRRPRFSFKGGEEMSPYSANCSTRAVSLPDGARTFSLSFADNQGSHALLNQQFVSGGAALSHEHTLLPPER